VWGLFTGNSGLRNRKLNSAKENKPAAPGLGVGVPKSRGEPHVGPGRDADALESQVLRGVPRQQRGGRCLFEKQRLEDAYMRVSEGSGGICSHRYRGDTTVDF
jgi:hypothetical protein